ncbi:LysR family transcriptional regulator [Acidithiobacillus caldus]|uniref:LysR family transcriptional regulator n=1 Tax=Acidithiobacillus caldus TaxID=33059 RepID=A0A1E7YQC9_9PROT|nr:LysR family transcriptional regulator [Acidithiobacillus caldus]MBU2790193.1 LysR family transcriptional regulator [Acidithiobacillus caldus]MBU2822038.1 LysR family transcriptional regulator [Acidithiobacillus caldus]OFC38399.1 LysR family transcriptional regulator [Acidithiobacillus caldus]OFC38633.1 LysR family transcriptional regulator [Acidithiobacillus caldus]OFC42080.1 LysR family transcriptional regulator [Acidithiobacillus caldus]
MNSQEERENWSLRANSLIRHVTFRQLQIFMAVCRHKSFTKAADELFLAQPTVSLQMKKLADAVGLSLFEQIGKEIRITDAGYDVYAACRDLFRVVESLETQISDRKGICRGRLRLGVVTTAKYIAPELLAAFGEQFPGIEFSMTVSNRGDIIRRIQDSEDDLYIMGQVPTDEVEVEATPFAWNPLTVMVQRGHPLTLLKKPVPLHAIAETSFLIREAGSGTRNAYLRLFSEKGLKLNVAMELSSNEAIKHAVASGLGISILSIHSLALEGTKGPVEILEVEDFPILRKWYLVHPRGKILSLTAQKFMEFTISQEQFITDRLVNLWPDLANYL